jgi:hypothetical protein
MDQSVTDSSSSRDSSISLDFIDPLTPATISSKLPSKKRKRERDETPDSLKQKSRKLSQTRSQRLSTPSKGVEATPSIESSITDSLQGSDDITSLFDPNSFQDCNTTWPETSDLNEMLASFSNSDPFDASAFTEYLDHVQWSDIYPLNAGNILAVPQIQGLETEQPGSSMHPQTLSNCLVFPNDPPDSLLAYSDKGIYCDDSIPAGFATLGLHRRVGEDISGQSKESDIIRELREQLLQKDAIIQQLQSQPLPINTL